MARERDRRVRGRLSRSRLARFRELVAETWARDAGCWSWIAPDHAQAWVRRPWICGRWVAWVGSVTASQAGEGSPARQDDARPGVTGRWTGRGRVVQPNGGTLVSIHSTDPVVARVQIGIDAAVVADHHVTIRSTMTDGGGAAVPIPCPTHDRWLVSPWRTTLLFPGCGRCRGTDVDDLAGPARRAAARRL